MNSIGSFFGIWEWVIVGLIAVLLFGKRIPTVPQEMQMPRKNNLVHRQQSRNEWELWITNRKIDFVLTLALYVLIIVFFVLFYTNFG